MSGDGDDGIDRLILGQKDAQRAVVCWPPRSGSGTAGKAIGNKSAHAMGSESPKATRKLSE